MGLFLFRENYSEYYERKRKGVFIMLLTYIVTFAFVGMVLVCGVALCMA